MWLHLPKNLVDNMNNNLKLGFSKILKLKKLYPKYFKNLYDKCTKYLQFDEDTFYKNINKFKIADT